MKLVPKPMTLCLKKFNQVIYFQELTTASRPYNNLQGLALLGGYAGIPAPAALIDSLM